MRIEGHIQSADVKSGMGTDALSKLKTGDVLRAEVVESSGNELLLKLSDGSKVSAFSFLPIHAENGEYINFVFKGMVDGKINLERFVPETPVQTGEQSLENIKLALSALKLPVTESNIKLAMALQEQNVQITGETMSRALSVVKGNSGITPNAAAFLVASNMSEDAAGIEKLQNLLAGRLRIASDIADLAKLTATSTSDGGSSAKPADVSEMLQKVFSNPSGNFGKITEKQLTGAQTKLTADKEAPSAITAGRQGNSASGENLVSQISRWVKGQGPNGPDSNSPLPPLMKADVPLLERMVSQVSKLMGQEEFSAGQTAALKFIAKEMNTLILKLKYNIETDGKNTPIAERETGELKNFREVVNSLRNAFVKIDRESGDIHPDKIYRDMAEALHNLRNSAQLLPIPLREAAMQIAGNLENNMNFINHLNNYSSYVQIPLSIFNHETTGELYMLKRGSKARKLDPSNLTVLISLDGINIGRIDALLNIDRKNVATNFRLESSDIFQALKDNHKALYTRLLEKGYRLVDFTYRLIDEPVNITNFESQAKKEFIKIPNNIDISV